MTETTEQEIRAAMIHTIETGEAPMNRTELAEFVACELEAIEENGDIPEIFFEVSHEVLEEMGL